MLLAERDIKIIDGEYTGKPPRPLRRNLDLLIGAGLIFSPLWAAFGYIRITVISAGLGLAFVVAQWFINRGEPSAVRRRVSMGLRIFAVVLLTLTVFIVFALDRGMKGFYSLRKGLFCFGNSVDSQELEFMPDSIPSGSSGFYMMFFPAANNGVPEARIRFTADGEGIKSLRETALQKGGKLVEKDSFVHKKLRVYCEETGGAMGDAEVYSFGEAGRNCPAYLIDPDTGLCIIYW